MGAMPYPLTTERLTLRFIRPGDEDVLTAYRNDPAVAALQDWDLPYERAQVRTLVIETAEPIAYQIDGDTVGACSRLEVSVLPRAVLVMVP